LAFDRDPAVAWIEPGQNRVSIATHRCLSPDSGGLGHDFGWRRGPFFESMAG